MPLSKIYPFSAESTVALLLATLAAAELYGAFRLPMSEDFTLGPGALPAAYAVGLLIFSAVLLLQSRRRQPVAEPRSADGMEAEAERSNVAAGLITIALLTSFIVAIYVVGFMISLVGFCFLFSWLISGLGLARSAVFAVSWGCAVYGAFVYLLQVPLERGLLFS